jgi:transcriptional regulator with XRE-family HTH domain
LSQLELALATGISQRHISFVESGRAQPSRELIVKLAHGLDLPLRTRNELFLAAGYAPVYGERRLDLAEMKPVREALERILDHHEPYPAIVTDRWWNVVLLNNAAKRIVGACLAAHGKCPALPSGEMNFMRLMFSEELMRPSIANWGEMRGMLLHRLRREAMAIPGSPSDELWREFGGGDAAANSGAFSVERALDPVLPLELRIGDAHLRLFAMFTSFGTSQDVALQELRIDMSFPADEATRQFLLNAADEGMEGALERQAQLALAAGSA